MSKSKVKFVKEDGLENSDFSVSKVRITTMVDKDLLDWLRSEADERGWKYQSLLNHILRQAKGSNPDRIAEIEQRLSKLEKKIS